MTLIFKTLLHHYKRKITPMYDKKLSQIIDCLQCIVDNLKG